jgi:hypothetical protein
MWVTSPSWSSSIGSGRPVPETTRVSASVAPSSRWIPRVVVTADENADRQSLPQVRWPVRVAENCHTSVPARAGVDGQEVVGCTGDHAPSAGHDCGRNRDGGLDGGVGCFTGIDHINREPRLGIQVECDQNRFVAPHGR